MFGFALPCAGMECRRPNEKGAMPNARAARTQVLFHPPSLPFTLRPKHTAACPSALLPCKQNNYSS
jgi:hypothetical protein